MSEGVGKEEKKGVEQTGWREEGVQKLRKRPQKEEEGRQNYTQPSSKKPEERDRARSRRMCYRQNNAVLVNDAGMKINARLSSRSSLYQVSSVPSTGTGHPKRKWGPHIPRSFKRPRLDSILFRSPAYHFYLANNIQLELATYLIVESILLWFFKSSALYPPPNFSPLKGVLTWLLILWGFLFKKVQYKVTVGRGQDSIPQNTQCARSGITLFSMLGTLRSLLRFRGLHVLDSTSRHVHLTWSTFTSSGYILPPFSLKSSGEKTKGKISLVYYCQKVLLFLLKGSSSQPEGGLKLLYLLLEKQALA